MVGPSPVQDAHACSLKNEFFSLICPLGGAKTTPPFFWHFLTAGCQAESVLFGDVQVTALKNYLYKSNSQET